VTGAKLLDGRVAVVTGSTRGFGLAVARAYAQAGASVIVSSRSAESVRRAVEMLQGEGLRASGHPCDVGDLNQVEALAVHALEAFGRLDMWVNNAALSPPYGPTAHIPVERFERATRTNVLGTYYGSLVALRHFLPRREGKLINILGRGERGPSPFQSGYAASKAWSRTFTLSLAKEYKDSGVGIYTLNPGMMPTDMLTDVEVIAGHEARMKVLATIIRMWANPPEVPAQKAVWLASPTTDGRTGLSVRLTSLPRILGGALREGLRRLLGRPAPPLDIQVRTVEPET
jgi:glucose 1-dehydrogenase